MMLTNVLSRGCTEGPQGVTRGVIKGGNQGVILRNTCEDECVD